jgi:hypothetical protein
MSLEIITAEQRINTATVKGQIWGGAGVGKTTLLKTLHNPSTLAIAPEMGLLAVQRDDEFGPRFTGDSTEPSTWEEHKFMLEKFQQSQRPIGLRKYRTIFIDSTSIISKQCWEWCKVQPEAFNKYGKPDTLNAYGLLGREMSSWAWGWKGIPDLNVWMIGGLEEKENDATKVRELKPLVMGSKIVAELPYIFDYSLVMARFIGTDNKPYTGLFTNPVTNPEYASVPVKTRGGGLSPIEQPHLGKLMAKALGFSPTTAPPPSAVPTEPGDGETPPETTQSEAA